jgi:purine-nucleoside/S-methyl-5'-thioadenosine phosphorylase / adenosine deaminase
MTTLRAPNLVGTEAIQHGFFGRTGGVSKGLYASLNCSGNDASENIEENRRRVAEVLGSGAHLVTLSQVHGARTITVTATWPLGRGPEADSMVTTTPGIALGILAADCTPVLFADVEAHVVGAAHAGWKGALAGVIENTIRAMEALGAKRSRIAAAAGPCISQPSYEVSAAFRDQFLRADRSTDSFFALGRRPDHFQFDLDGFVAGRLREAGLASVWQARTCTYQRESDYFSYRRATHRGETDYGRQVSAILLCK